MANMTEMAKIGPSLNISPSRTTQNQPEDELLGGVLVSRPPSRGATFDGSSIATSSFKPEMVEPTPQGRKCSPQTSPASKIDPPLALKADVEAPVEILDRISPEEKKQLQEEIRQVNCDIKTLKEQQPALVQALAVYSVELDSAEAYNNRLFDSLNDLFDYLNRLFDHQANLYDVRNQYFETRSALYSQQSVAYSQLSNAYANQLLEAPIKVRLDNIARRISAEDQRINAQDVVISDWNEVIASHNQLIDQKNAEISNYSSVLGPAREKRDTQEYLLQQNIRKIKILERKLLKLEARLDGQPEPGPNISINRIVGTDVTYNFNDEIEGPVSVTFQVTGRLAIQKTNGMMSVGPRGVYSSCGSAITGASRFQMGMDGPIGTVTLLADEGVLYVFGVRIHYVIEPDTGALATLNVTCSHNKDIVIRGNEIDIWEAHKMPTTEARAGHGCQR